MREGLSWIDTRTRIEPWGNDEMKEMAKLEAANLAHGCFAAGGYILATADGGRNV